MSETGLSVFDTTIQKTNAWLRDIMYELGTEDRHRAYLALRATLQTLRDRLTLEEAAHLGAQLPMLIRGLYYEGWNPSHQPIKIKNQEEFFNNIRDYFVNEPDIDAKVIALAVFKILAFRVTQGEMEDIGQILPKELKEIWPHPFQEMKTS